jgi:PRTRC genetic system protein F
MAEWAWWAGCSSPEEYADYNGLEGEERAEYLEQVIRPEQLDGSAPAWIKQHRRLTRAQAQRLSKTQRDPFVREVGRALCALMRERDSICTHETFHSRVMNDDGAEFVGWGAILRWSRRDHMVDLLEAIGQHAYDSGVAYDICGQWSFVLRVDDLVTCLTELDGAGRMVRAMDDLIGLLARRSFNGQQLNKASRERQSHSR